jgi:hypothetical protein
LLLLWAEGNVPSTVRPDAVSAWLAARAERARTEPAESQAPLSPELLSRPTTEPSTFRTEAERGRERRADERAARVRAGLDEFDRWLADQVRRGLTAPEVARRETWEGVIARLVDAQAGALANRVRRATDLVAAGMGWHERVLGEMANLHSIATAGTRLTSLDEDLATSVRTAVGWTVAKEEVLAGAPITDRWHVVGRSDTEEHRITVRRTWLLGRDTGQWALVLAFAAFGESLDEHPPVGTVLHADLHHFPGRVPLRALIGVEHEPATDDLDGPQPSSIAGTVADAGWALAREPWLERWPGVVLAAPAVSRGTVAGWVLVDDTGSLPLVPGRGLVTLLAASGGRPVIVAGEHRAAGFAPLSVRVHDRSAIVA